MAHAGEVRRFDGEPDGYEDRFEFVSTQALDQLCVPGHQQLLVRAALELAGEDAAFSAS